MEFFPEVCQFSVNGPGFSARLPLPDNDMLYMIIENYRNGDSGPVYKRFREKGRLAPDGLEYISSWVTPYLTTCYQVMRCDDRSLLDEWMSHWNDLVDFEVIPVITSADAAARSAAARISRI